jgi:integrase
MKQRFRLYRRAASGRYYAHDNVTGRQESLKTSDRTEALRLLNAKNEAEFQPAFNAQLARTYLAAGDAVIGQRTWQLVMDTLLRTKERSSASCRARYERAIKQKSFNTLRSLPLLQTRPEHLLGAIERGTVSTNMFLRRLHSFALKMGWLPWPILGYRQWPCIQHKSKRGITWEEHQMLLDRERDPERKAFLELLWHVGAAQIDLVSLTAESIDWPNRTISYRRRKNGSLAILRFGDEVAAILRRLPTFGPLFPNFSKISSSDRAARFNKKCRSAGICGVSLHSYRYAWAERARAAGYPERYAQEALGHNSASIHRAYAKKARVELPPLEEYESEHAAKIVPLTAERQAASAVAQA